MSEPIGVDQTVYRCKTCGVRFSVPQHETVACCPVCRMNRIVSVEA